MPGQRTRSTCDLCTSNFSITRTLSRNASSQAPPRLTDAGALEVEPSNLVCRPSRGSWCTLKSEDHMLGCWGAHRSNENVMIGTECSGYLWQRSDFQSWGFREKVVFKQVENTSDFWGQYRDNPPMRFGSSPLGSCWYPLQGNWDSSHFYLILKCHPNFQPTTGRLDFTV